MAKSSQVISLTVYEWLFAIMSNNKPTIVYKLIVALMINNKYAIVFTWVCFALQNGCVDPLEKTLKKSLTAVIIA